MKPTISRSGLAFVVFGCLLSFSSPAAPHYVGPVACQECQPMPLPPELGQFPLLSAHAKRQVTWFRRERWLQTICLTAETTADSAAGAILNLFPDLKP